MFNTSNSIAGGPPPPPAASRPTAGNELVEVESCKPVCNVDDTNASNKERSYSCAARIRARWSVVGRPSAASCSIIDPLNARNCLANTARRIKVTTSFRTRVWTSSERRAASSRATRTCAACSGDKPARERGINGGSTFGTTGVAGTGIGAGAVDVDIEVDVTEGAAAKEEGVDDVIGIDSVGDATRG
jgi:hypothetical protein